MGLVTVEIPKAQVRISGHEANPIFQVLDLPVCDAVEALVRKNTTGCSVADCALKAVCESQDYTAYGAGYQAGGEQINGFAVNLTCEANEVWCAPIVRVAAESIAALSDDCNETIAKAKDAAFEQTSDLQVVGGALMLAGARMIEEADNESTIIQQRIFRRVRQEMQAPLPRPSRGGMEN